LGNKKNNSGIEQVKDPRLTQRVPRGEVIILFDGVCNLCNRTINFIIDRDNKNIFKFAAFQSEAGQNYLKKNGIFSTELDTVILIDNDKFYKKSTAGLRIVKELKGGWKIFYLLIIIPSFIRDFFYNIIAKNRYKWFGKSDTCRVPTKELQDKFL